MLLGGEDMLLVVCLRDMGRGREERTGKYGVKYVNIEKKTYQKSCTTG